MAAAPTPGPSFWESSSLVSAGGNTQLTLFQGQLFQMHVLISYPIDFPVTMPAVYNFDPPGSLGNGPRSVTSVSCVLPTFQDFCKLSGPLLHPAGISSKAVGSLSFY